jgi:hypothetical protein
MVKIAVISHFVWRIFEVDKEFFHLFVKKELLKRFFLQFVQNIKNFSCSIEIACASMLLNQRY